MYVVELALFGSLSFQAIETKVANINLKRRHPGVQFLVFRDANWFLARLGHRRSRKAGRMGKSYHIMDLTKRELLA